MTGTGTGTVIGTAVISLQFSRDCGSRVPQNAARGLSPLFGVRQMRTGA